MEYLKRIKPSGYLERLRSLIEERLDSGADKDAIDARIWDVFGVTRSILFTDLSGFSRFVAAFGIVHFLQVIHESRRIFEPCIDAHDGVLIKVDGDSMLILIRRRRARSGDP